MAGSPSAGESEVPNIGKRQSLGRAKEEVTVLSFGRHGCLLKVYSFSCFFTWKIGRSLENFEAP